MYNVVYRTYLSEEREKIVFDIAKEGIGDTIRSMGKTAWDAVVAAVKWIRDKIKNLWVRITKKDTHVSKETAAENARKEAQASSGEEKAKMEQILKEMNQSSEEYKKYYETMSYSIKQTSDYINKTIGIAEKLIDAIRNKRNTQEFEKQLTDPSLNEQFQFATRGTKRMEKKLNLEGIHSETFKKWVKYYEADAMADNMKRNIENLRALQASVDKYGKFAEQSKEIEPTKGLKQWIVNCNKCIKQAGSVLAPSGM